MLDAGAGRSEWGRKPLGRKAPITNDAEWSFFVKFLYRMRNGIVTSPGGQPLAIASTQAVSEAGSVEIRVGEQNVVLTAGRTSTRW
jgi:hypothetical protein